MRHGLATANGVFGGQLPEYCPSELPVLRLPWGNGSAPRLSISGELARDVESLGPSFVKLRQLLSTRPDIIPPAYATAVSRLLDNCGLFPFAQVEEILTERARRLPELNETFAQFWID
jgi:predicted unusual protein kinase regulating ubiquinone biosynthesis (AarF/ABC1/UbiB family)